MKVLEIPSYQCHICYDSYHGLVNKETKQITFIHEFIPSVIQTRCENERKSFIVSISNFYKEV